MCIQSYFATATCAFLSDACITTADGRLGLPHDTHSCMCNQPQCIRQCSAPAPYHRGGCRPQPIQVACQWRTHSADQTTTPRSQCSQSCHRWRWRTPTVSVHRTWCSSDADSQPLGRHWVDTGLVNGAMGTVTDICYQSGGPQICQLMRIRVPLCQMGQFLSHHSDAHGTLLVCSIHDCNSHSSSHGPSPHTRLKDWPSTRWLWTSERRNFLQVWHLSPLSMSDASVICCLTLHSHSSAWRILRIASVCKNGSSKMPDSVSLRSLRYLRHQISLLTPPLLSWHLRVPALLICLALRALSSHLHQPLPAPPPHHIFRSKPSQYEVPPSQPQPSHHTYSKPFHHSYHSKHSQYDIPSSQPSDHIYSNWRASPSGMVKSWHYLPSAPTHTNKFLWHRTVVILLLHVHTYYYFMYV